MNLRQDKVNLIRCLCMSSPSPLHRLATQNFDERYKRKQSESFLSQSELTICELRLHGVVENQTSIENRLLLEIFFCRIPVLI